MTLVRINPFDEWEKKLNQFFRGRRCVPASRCSTEEPEVRTWAPSADISENDSELVFTLDVPGLEKEELNISVDNGVLTVTGERKPEEVESHDRHRVERWYGKIQRSFRLPRTVDAEKITATLKNGVLTLVIPKKEDAKPREIPVSIQ
jgi:HSP20 family protein